MAPEQETREKNPAYEEVRLHPSKVVRSGYVAAGFVSLGLGTLGVVLPVLPTTVFILLAAYFFARSSPRFYAALLKNRYAGPMIRNWQANRCISRTNKIYAISLIVLTFGVTIGLFIQVLLLRIVLLVVGISLIVYLSSLRTCDS